LQVFIFLVPCIIVAFDAVPTNISVLFFPGVVASLKKMGLNNNKPKSTVLNLLYFTNMFVLVLQKTTGF